MESVQDQIEQILVENFQPDHLEIINESHKHKGHAGDDGSGQTHFKVVISAKILSAYNRIERQRQVYSALSDLMRTHIHALSLSVID